LPHQQVYRMAVTIAVKKIAYRWVEIFFDKLVDIGEGLLGIYGPPGESVEMALLEEFPSDTVFRLFPARICASGKRVRRISFPSALAHRHRDQHHLPFHLDVYSGPLRSVGRSYRGRGTGVWWYTGNLGGSRSARRSKRDEQSELPCVGIASHSVRGCAGVRTTTAISQLVSTLPGSINEKCPRK